MPDSTPPPPLSTQVFQILLSLVDDDLHGYAIIQDVAQRTDGEVRLTASTLYAAVKRLLDSGWIEECAAAARRRRPPPPLLPSHAAGRQAARAEALRLDRLAGMARAKQLIPRVKPMIGSRLPRARSRCLLPSRLQRRVRRRHARRLRRARRATAARARCSTSCPGLFASRFANDARGEHSRAHHGVTPRLEENMFDSLRSGSRSSPFASLRRAPGVRARRRAHARTRHRREHGDLQRRERRAALAAPPRRPRSAGRPRRSAEERDDDLASTRRRRAASSTGSRSRRRCSIAGYTPVSRRAHRARRAASSSPAPPASAA